MVQAARTEYIEVVWRPLQPNNSIFVALAVIQPLVQLSPIPKSDIVVFPSSNYDIFIALVYVKRICVAIVSLRCCSRSFDSFIPLR